jgi:hypothetical protein
LTAAGSSADYPLAHCCAACNENRRMPRPLLRLSIRHAVLLLIAWLFSIPSGWANAGGTPTADPTQFTSATYGFGLVLPTAWVSIPVDLINQQLAQLVSTQLAPQIESIAAFQRGPDRRNIQRPFCTVQAVSTGWRGGPNPEQFNLVIKALSANDKIFNEEWGAASLYTPAQVKEFRALLSGSSPGPVHADLAAQHFWRVVDGTGSSGEAVRSFSSGFFLKNGNMILLNCYADRPDFRREVDDFAAIYRSLRDLSQ